MRLRIQTRCVGLATAALLAACSELPFVPENGTAALAAAGVVQVLDVRTSVDGGEGRFAITSTLLNTGDGPTTVRVRSCYLRDSDLRGDRGGLSVEEPLMLCAREDQQVTLLPGASSAPLTLTGRAAPGATHALEVRHGVRPDRWAPLTLRIR